MEENVEREDLLAVFFTPHCKSNRDRKVLDYTSEIPSLQSTAIVSVAAMLWAWPNLKKDIELHRGQARTFVYEQLEKIVLEKLNEIFLPPSLKLKVSNIIKPIGLQLLTCYVKEDGDCCSFHDVIKMGGSIYWTMEGTIDKVKSVKELISDNRSTKNLCDLFRFACNYCLEEHISELWVNLSIAEKNSLESCLKFSDHILQYWICVVKNESPQFFTQNSDVYHSSIYDYLIFHSMKLGNVYAVKYFWNKLTHREINTVETQLTSFIIDSYERTANQFNCQSYNECTDIICFLLPRIGSQYLENICRYNSDYILKMIFFSWPFQKFFSHTLLVIFDYLSDGLYIKITSDIVDEIKEGKTSPDLFRAVWQHSPSRLKKLYIDNFCSLPITIRTLFNVEDFLTIQLVLKDATTNRRNKAVFSILDAKKEFEFEFIESGKGRSFDMLLSKLLPSECDVLDFKAWLMSEFSQSFFGRLAGYGHFLAALEFLDWGFPSQNEIVDFKKNKIDKMDLYSSLILINDYDLLNQFLKWCFESEEQICIFKIYFATEDSINRRRLLLGFSNHGQHGWDLFEIFIRFTSSSNEDIVQIKKSFLKGVDFLLEKGVFEFSDSLLNWCIDSADEVTRFKHELFLSDRGIDLLLQHMNNGLLSFTNLRKAIQWMCPLSNQVVTYIKSRLRDKELRGECSTLTAFLEENFQYLFNLMDNTLEMNNKMGRGK